ncbi:FUSC family protein [Altererythrobacter xixiisoli]|uniref:FUSC family protein n=2 Tax=Croceibacterium xixiisoli TaxID=1476466 RepID=A0A6I4TS09_9SPHN|nr:FUSC family protein [Croceibacterium xixiisoli]
MVVARQPSLRNAALAGVQSALTVAIALPLAHLSPWPHLIGFAALGALASLFGRFAPAGRRERIVLHAALVQTLAVLLMSAAVMAGAGPVLQLALLALASGAFFFIATRGQFGPPGSLIFIFAASACMGAPGSMESWGVIAQRTAATGAAALLAWTVCAATERWRQQASPDAPFPADPVWPLPRHLLVAARIALGAGIAAFAVYAAGAAHPAWAAMGAVAVMQGTHLHISMNRALQRMAGTMVGALIVWAILAQSPSVWAVIGLLVVIQLVTEIVIGSNYAFGQILVTPMALLMTFLAAPHVHGTAMVPERVADTLAGAVIGMVLAVLCSTLEDRLHLARHRSG